MTLNVRAWGTGDPVIALHPLALDGSAFGSLASALADRGLRTLAPDLPGFGASPAPAGSLTPARMARAVVELARGLDTPPALVGLSMGGRVALEAALQAPEAFRAVVAVAPFLPWLRYRSAFPLARLLSPAAAQRIPLERAWPLMKGIGWLLETVAWLGDDAIARASARVVYQASCPATRASIVSAAREMALDPPAGERSVWTRLQDLAIPAAFIWGGRDRLVPLGFARRTAVECPAARQMVLPCAGHALNGPHHACLSHAVASILLIGDASQRSTSSGFELGRCLAPGRRASVRQGAPRGAGNVAREAAGM